MKRIKTQAFIFKKKNLLDKNLLITFFTKDLGKINVFAYGVKKLTSKRLSSLQTGNFVEVILERRKNGYFLIDSLLKSGFLSIKKNDKKINIVFLIFFILDHILAENQKEEKIFNQTLNFLITLSKNKKNFKKIIIDFINKILLQLGFIRESLTEEKLFLFIEELINEKIPSFLKYNIN